MNNKTIGNAFEREFCEILSQHGFWVHNFANTRSGQPADIIAVRDNNSYLIDCKVCSRQKFDISRVEENQHFSMESWKNAGNEEPWFALKLDEDRIYMIAHADMVDLSYEKATLNEQDICDYGLSLEKWLKSC